MSGEENRCTYKPERGNEYQCKHFIYKNGLCVFHLPKSIDPEIREMSEPERQETQKIKETFHHQFLRLLDAETAIYDFRYFIFPSIECSQYEFKKPVNFENAIFYDQVSFVDAIFKEEVDFNGANFKNSADFNMPPLTAR